MTRHHSGSKKLWASKDATRCFPPRAWRKECDEGVHSAPRTDVSPELSYFSIFVSLFLALIFALLLRTCAPIHPSLSHVNGGGAHGEQFGTGPKRRSKYHSNLSAQNKSFPKKKATSKQA